jgi:pimeloyl-ACP methyl ester carboxylesterase
MPKAQPMSDIVVVLPGITGSMLAIGDDRNVVWGLSGRAVMNGVLSLGRSVDRLKLPEGFGDALPEKDGEGEPADGVRAVRLMPDLHVIPGLWSPIKGYVALMEQFRDRFTVSAPTAERPGNLLEVPYDWRLSNAVSARRLAAAAVPALERWRQHTNNPDAKLVLVCHSMGGLVARWFLEVLGGWELTRWLITVGTPYQGAVNALETLVNGVSKGLGPFRKDLTGLVRSLPSLYELLPTYPCFDAGGGKYQALSDISGLGLNSKMLASAAAFHRRIADKVGQRPERGYGIVAIKGIFQPTSQSARPAEEGVEALHVYGGVDRGGDGTVPRPSAHPPEWGGEGEGLTVGAAQRHATLQETEGVYAQLFMRLTGRLGTWMGGEQIGIDLPTLVPAGEPIIVDVRAADPTLALNATVTPHDSAVPVASPQLLTNMGEGRYRTQFSELRPGTYQVTVGSAVLTGPVEPVSDVTIVWEPHAA